MALPKAETETQIGNLKLEQRRFIRNSTPVPVRASAAEIQSAGSIGVDHNEIWVRLKIDGVPLDRYVGRGTHGAEKLREI